jgi:TRAP-type C4-dicarboxylate transport system permease small subunit
MAESHNEGTADRGGPAKVWQRVYDGLGHLGGVILAIMTGAVFLQVVFRFIGSTGIDGIEEVPRYLFVWLIMIGGASAMYCGEHTILDYFVSRVGTRLRASALVLTTGAGIGLFVYLLKMSFVLVPNAQMQTSAGLGLPLGYVFAAIPVGAVLIVLPMARTFLAALRTLWRKRS